MKKQINNSDFLKRFKDLEASINRIANIVGEDKTFRNKLSLAAERNYLLRQKMITIIDLYSIRNVIAHGDRDKYIATINEYAFNELTKIVEFLNHPPTVSDVLKRAVFIGSESDTINDIMEQMSRNTYTHVPIYDNDGKYSGVFTETSLFVYIQDKQQFIPSTTLADIPRKYINTKDNFIKFLPASTSILDVFSYFETAIQNKQRLGVILFTESGSSGGDLVSIVTAQDLPILKNAVD